MHQLITEGLEERNAEQDKKAVEKKEKEAKHSADNGCRTM